MTKIAIIGAGISGLTTANLLKQDAEITIFEKSNGVGGRMSTRRAESYFFDHGAQYFTARTKQFQNFIQPMHDQGIIEHWNARYVRIDGYKIIERRNWHDEIPRYVGVPGMNHVAKILANGIDIRFNTRITSLSQNGKWQLIDDQHQQFDDFDWVISTIPSHQAAALLPKNVPFVSDINTIKMSACFALMLGFNKSLPIEFDAAHVTNSDISWIAVNRRKPKRSGPFTLMIHSSDKYADAHIDGDRDKAMRHLIEETAHIIGEDIAAADYKTIHGWRYANNANRDQKNISLLDHEHKIAACGDWSQGGRVEGAFTSAHDLVQKLKSCIL